jgi:hypothetical protein
MRESMPSNLAVAIARKREALKLERNIHTMLLMSFIACLLVLVLLRVSPSFAAATELLMVQ